MGKEKTEWEDWSTGWEDFHCLWVFSPSTQTASARLFNGGTNKQWPNNNPHLMCKKTKQIKWKQILKEDRKSFVLSWSVGACLKTNSKVPCRLLLRMDSLGKPTGLWWSAGKHISCCWSDCRVNNWKTCLEFWSDGAGRPSLPLGVTVPPRDNPQGLHSSVWVCKVMEASGLPPGLWRNTATLGRLEVFSRNQFFSSLISDVHGCYEFIFLISVSVSALSLSDSSCYKSALRLLIRSIIKLLSHCARHFRPTSFNSVSSGAASRLINQVSRALDESTFRPGLCFCVAATS